MYRKCIEQLKQWVERVERGVMVLRGARQVGKTTLVRLMAKEECLVLIEVNLEDKPSFIGMLDKKSNAKEILELIMIENGINESPDNVLFFFDEIQESPGFYAYLRYFKEVAPEYRVIVAGSLLDLEIKNSDSSQGPTGRVEYTYLEPMTYEEFLIEVNPLAYKKLLTQSLLKPVGESMHKVYSDLFKNYMVCGGMPAAVKAFAENQGALRIDEIKTNLFTGYLNDLPKYSGLCSKRYEAKLLQLLLKKITGDPTNSMSLSKLAPEVKAAKIREHLSVLLDARVIRKTIHTYQNKPPLLSGANDKKHKLFALDIGICYSFMEITPQDVYVQDDINDIAKGALAEQYTAQTLAALPPHYKEKALYHWERDSRGATAEVDFIAVFNGMAVPIECKSGHSNQMKSLKLLLQEKPFSLAVRLYAGNITHEEISVDIDNKKFLTKLISVPHYMLERLAESIHTI